MSSYPVPLNTITEIPIEYAPFPEGEGPRAIPLLLNFANGGVQIVDLLNFQQLSQISMVQAVFVDNAANPYAMTILNGMSNQRIIVPAGAQGYFSMLAPNPVRLSISSAGTAIATVFLLNIPVTNALWYASGSSGTYNNGNLQVTDPTLDGIVSNGRLATQNSVVGNGGTLYPQTVGNIAVTGSLTANGNSGVLITGAPGYVLTAIALSLSPSATQATAGDFIVKAVDSGAGTIFQSCFQVGTANATDSMLRADTPGSFWWNNKASASTLVLNLSAALTAGKVYYNLYYALATYFG